MDWYVLVVETGKEDLVRTMILKYLKKQPIHAIVPKRKLQERRLGQSYEVCRTMFPGYVFVKTEMNVKTYYDFKRLPKCYRLLNRFNNNDNHNNVGEEDKGENIKYCPENFLFSKIDVEEISLILQLIGNDELIEYSTLHVENAKVIVHDGPLKGMEGIIKKIDKRKKRARIVMDIMGSKRYLDVGINILETSESH